MLRRDKALLESLTKKYSKRSIMNELYLGPKKIKETPIKKEFKYLEVNPSGFTIVVGYDKRYRPLEFKYVKNIDDIYFENKKGEYGRARLNGIDELIVYDEEKVDEIMKYFETYNPNSRFNNRRIFDYRYYI